MKRLLVIYPHFGPYHAARWRALCAALPASGFEPLGLQVFARPDQHEWGSVRAPTGVRDLALATATRDRLRWADAPRLWRALRAARPDVVAINGWRTREALLCHAWCRRHRVPRVVVADSLPAEDRGAMFRDRAKSAIIRGVGSAFVAGAPQRRYLESLGVPAAAIWQGCDAVDNAHFAAARALRGPAGQRLLTVARFAPEKNLLAAGRAFLQFATQRPAPERWCWRLAGYGPLRSALQELAAASQGHIELLGRRDYDALPATYAAADLYWQPSLRDTWALPVNEAMASGLPVLVSTRCGCAEDLVTPDTGWTCDPLREETLCAGLALAAATQAQWPAMGECAARRIDAWGLEAFVAGLAGAARTALAGGRS